MTNTNNVTQPPQQYAPVLRSGIHCETLKDLEKRFYKMSVIKVLRDLNELFNYSTDENPTSQQDYQEAVKNWVKTIVSLVDINLWQPETEYVVGDTVYIKFMQNKGGSSAALFFLWENEC